MNGRQFFACLDDFYLYLNFSLLLSVSQRITELSFWLSNPEVIIASHLDSQNVI